MTTDDTGKAFIKSFESLRLQAYADPGPLGKQCWTIGYGHTAEVAEGMEIDEATADKWFDDDVARVDASIPHVIRVPLTQGQWNALASLCFNLQGGPLRLPKIAPRLVAYLNRGAYASGAYEFLDVTKSAGVVMPGLVRRRKAEYVMFMADTPKANVEITTNAN